MARDEFLKRNLGSQTHDLRKLKKVFCCLHCESLSKQAKNRKFNFEGLVSHTRDKHSMVRFWDLGFYLMRVTFSFRFVF